MGMMIESGLATLEGTQLQLQHMMEAHVEVTNGSSPICNFHQDYPEQQLLNLLPYSNFSATAVEPPSGFIDAWSTNNLNSDQRNLSPSFNLPVDMTAENVMDQDRRKIIGGSDVKHFDGHKTKDDLRNSTPVSWEPFARGGPLAVATEFSTPATTISSPSGVNHRALFSNSDSSVCNSPTLAAPP